MFSSFSVSFKIVSSSPFLCLRWSVFSDRVDFTASTDSFLSSICALNSLIFFSASWISSSWYSVSLVNESNSRLFLTFFCCSVYFFIKAFASSIRFFLDEIWSSNSLRLTSNFSILLLSPSISSSKSLTSKGNSPLISLILSILESINCKSYRALNFSSTVGSFFLAILTVFYRVCICFC